VTDLLTFTLSEQLPVPLHDPDQPRNTEPGAAIALNLIEVPFATDAEHVEPQLIAAGVLVTVPAPLPAFRTETVAFATVVVTLAKYAATLLFAVRETAQLPLPEHPPLQRENA